MTCGYTKKNREDFDQPVGLGDDQSDSLASAGENFPANRESEQKYKKIRLRNNLWSGYPGYLSIYLSVHVSVMS